MKKLLRRGLLLIVFLLVLQLLVGATAVLADPGYHMVRAGETLYSIGRLYGVNPYTIAAANDLSNPDYIYIGQVLYIPVGTGPPPPPPPPPPGPYYPPGYWYPPNYWWCYWYCYGYPYWWYQWGW